MPWRQIWVLGISQTLLVKVISWPIVGFLSTESPRLFGCEEALPKHWSGVSALRSVTVDEDVTHFQTKLF